MYLILDLEWNRLNSEERKKLNLKKCINNEIFQIGAILVDEDTNYKGCFSKFIRLETTKKLSSRLVKMGIKEKNIIESNIGFEQALCELAQMLDRYSLKRCKKTKKREVTVITWGNYDEIVFKENIDYYYRKKQCFKLKDKNLNPLADFKFKWINIQKGIVNYLQLDNDLGLAKACEMMDVSILNDRFHNSLDDAYATIGVVRKIGMPILEQLSKIQKIAMNREIKLKEFKNLKYIVLDRTHAYLKTNNALECTCLVIDAIGVEKVIVCTKYINGACGFKLINGIDKPRGYFNKVKKVINMKKDKEIYRANYKLKKMELLKAVEV